jgi:methyl-accepting chemotaxis protein
MTQQNAALVEQIAAAAESMQGQATSLSTALLAFKLNNVASVTSAWNGISQAQSHQRVPLLSA